MTARRARATTKARTNTGVSPLRRAKARDFGRDDGEWGRVRLVEDVLGWRVRTDVWVWDGGRVGFQKNLDDA